MCNSERMGAFGSQTPEKWYVLVAVIGSTRHSGSNDVEWFLRRQTPQRPRNEECHACGKPAIRHSGKLYDGIVELNFYELSVEFFL